MKPLAPRFLSLLTLPAIFVSGCAAPGPMPAAAPALPVALDTTSVKIVGENAALEKTKVEEHVGYWTNVDTFVEWPLARLKPGYYRVEMVYSLDPQFPGSTIAVSAAGQTLTTVLQPTKNWDDYLALDMGTIKLEKPADAVLTVKAVNKPPKYVMNLQKVILTPVTH